VLRLDPLDDTARGDDPAEVGADLRDGIRLLGDCGWLTADGPAQEGLGRWLAEQGRAEESAQMLAAARAPTNGSAPPAGSRVLSSAPAPTPDQRLARL
jgi:hypothetical protein